MPPRCRICCFAIASWLLIYSPDVSGADWKLPQTVTVDAGQHTRHDCAVMLEFDVAIPRDGEWHLQEIGRGESRPVAAQVDNMDPRRVWWIMSGETAAGAKRQYEFQPGKADRLLEIVIDKDDDSLTVRAGDKSVLRYNTSHVLPPKGIDPGYGRSAYIHPVWTPKGEMVTEEFPADHAHQSGIFLAYTKAVFEGRPTNFWEINGNKGRVRFKSVVSTTNGPVFGAFKVAQEHVDLTVPGGKVAVNETWDVRAWQMDGLKSGYWIFDVESSLTCATDKPLQLPTYHYGGFAVRGAKTWGKDVTHFITSEKHDRQNGNHTRPKWSDLYGPVSNGEQAGIAIFTHPKNFRFPEPVRIHPTMPYFVYTASPLGDWSIEPEQPHVTRYRCVVHDGPPNAERLQQLWVDFAELPVVKVVQSQQ